MQRSGRHCKLFVLPTSPMGDHRSASLRNYSLDAKQELFVSRLVVPVILVYFRCSAYSVM